MKRLALFGGPIACVLVALALLFVWWLPRHREAQAFDEEVQRAVGLLADKEFEAAEAQLQRVVALAEGLGEGDARLALSIDRMGAFYRERGDYEQARLYHLRSLTLHIRNHGRDDPGVTPRLLEVAADWLHTGQLDAAETTYRQALQRTERGAGADSAEVAAILMKLADVYAARPDWVGAETLCGRAVAIYRKLLPNNARDLAAALESQAQFLSKLERLDDAKRLQGEARTIHDAAEAEESE